MILAKLFQEVYTPDVSLVEIARKHNLAPFRSRHSSREEFSGVVSSVAQPSVGDSSVRLASSMPDTSEPRDTRPRRRPPIHSSRRHPIATTIVASLALSTLLTGAKCGGEAAPTPAGPSIVIIEESDQNGVVVEAQQKDYPGDLRYSRILMKILSQIPGSAEWDEDFSQGAMTTGKQGYYLRIPERYVRYGGRYRVEVDGTYHEVGSEDGVNLKAQDVFDIGHDGDITHPENP